tara:strand:- start:5125 stop:5484 length:360 start_codon:yes stop_codon:yes gene_type:complete
MITGHLIKLSGKIENVTVEDYKDIQKYVGGNFERVPTRQGDNCDVYVNDEGRIKELPINAVAILWLTATKRYDAIEDTIHGDVLVLGPIDEDGENTNAYSLEELNLRPLYKDVTFTIIA